MSNNNRDHEQRKRSRSSEDDDDDENEEDDSHGGSIQNELDDEGDGEDDQSESETDALGSPSAGSRKKKSNSNALKTKQWREKQKSLHEKRKVDLNKVHEENASLRRENEELRKKILLLEGTGQLIPQSATTAAIGISDVPVGAGGEGMGVNIGISARLPSLSGGSGVVVDSASPTSSVAPDSCLSKVTSSANTKSTARNHGSAAKENASIDGDDNVKNSAAIGLGNGYLPPHFASLLAAGTSDLSSSRREPSSLSELLSGSDEKAGVASSSPVGSDNNELLAKILALQRNQQLATPVQPNPLKLPTGGVGDLDALKRVLLLQQQQHSALNPLFAGALSTGVQRSQQEASLAARLEAIHRASNPNSAVNIQNAIASRNFLEESRRQQIDASLRLALQRQLQGANASAAPASLNMLAALQQRQQQPPPGVGGLPGASSASIKKQGSAGQQRTSPQHGPSSNLSGLSEAQLLALIAAKQNPEFQNHNGKT